MSAVRYCMHLATNDSSFMLILRFTNKYSFVFVSFNVSRYFKISNYIAT